VVAAIEAEAGGKRKRPAARLLTLGNVARLGGGKERLMRVIYAIAVLMVAMLAAPAPSRADDFPSDVKRTFQTDIPHFFQDDIPCAFGGKPTSGAKTSCKGPSHPAAAPHKATTHKKKRATKPAAQKATPNTSAPSAGANTGNAAGTPAPASPAPR
jgi:hypothetical protein